MHPRDRERNAKFEARLEAAKWLIIDLSSEFPAKYSRPHTRHGLAEQFLDAAWRNIHWAQEVIEGK